MPVDYYYFFYLITITPKQANYYLQGSLHKIKIDHKGIQITDYHSNKGKQKHIYIFSRMDNNNINQRNISTQSLIKKDTYEH